MWQKHSRRSSPGIIRFGGSTTEGFDWTATIGDPTRRVPFTTYWGGLEPGNAGLEEFVQLCEWVDAEPLICIRFTGKTPQDAADQVEYFNGAADTPMGHQRAAERPRRTVRRAVLADRQRTGRRKLPAGCGGVLPGHEGGRSEHQVDGRFPVAGLLQAGGPAHRLHLPAPLRLRQPAGDGEPMCSDCSKCSPTEVPGRDIRLGITEWNTTAGDWRLDRAMLWTLDNALWCARYHNFMHRHCDLIEIANRSNLTDSFCSGIIQTNNHALFKTPTYYVQELYANHAGPHATDRAYPAAGDLPADLPDPALDCSATLSADGTTLALFVVNHTTTLPEADDRPVRLHPAGRRNRSVRSARYGGCRRTRCVEFVARTRSHSHSTQHGRRTRQSSRNVQFAPLSITCLKIRVKE